MPPTAFFDLDGTLLTVSSIFRFLEYDEPGRYGATMDRLARLTGREARNRAFYRVFAGRAAADLAERGEEWFRDEYAAGGLFRPAVLSRFRAHQRAGHHTVLLSGSFPPCADPIARYLGAASVVCTRPTVVAGRYTGDVGVPMVGRHKPAAAREIAERNGSALPDCYAYGDDVSDLPLLEIVGHPVVVGDDPLLGDHADRLGWTRLPRTHLVTAERR